jgi:integrase
MLGRKIALPSQTLRIKGPVPSGSKMIFKVTGTTYYPKKDRVRQSFDSKQEAVDWISREDQRARKNSVEGDTRFTWLTAEDEQDALAAKNLLEENGYEGSLLSAAAAFIHGKPMEIHESVSMETALECFKEYFEGMGNTQRHIDSTFLRLNRFAKAWRGEEIGSMSKERTKEWILCRAPGQKGPWDDPRRSKVKPSERTKEKAALSVFFNYCVDKGWLESSPIAGIKVPKACGDQVSLPEIYTPEQAEALLQAARLLDDQRSADTPPSVPFFVLGLFCGLRPAEVGRLDWKHFIWNEDATVEINVNDKRSTVKRRTIEVPENAVAWLSLYRKEEGQVWGKNSRKIIDQVYAIAGYKAPKSSIPKDGSGPLEGLKQECESSDRPIRIHDGLRHSAVSYRLKDLQEPGKVALWSGHSEAIMHKHYKGLCSDTEARKFWGIMPPALSFASESKILAA